MNIPSRELDHLCGTASRLARLCAMIGRGDAPYPDALDGPLHQLDNVLDALTGEEAQHVHDHDPDTDPYIWE